MGHALVDHVARRAGIRLLAIKGPALQAMGLRDGHPSNDVDVLVDPERRDEFVASWGRWGGGAGSSAPPPTSSSRTPCLWLMTSGRSRSMCTTASPVCSRPRRSASRRCGAAGHDIALAHQSLRALLPSAAATIAALHYLRSSNREPELDAARAGCSRRSSARARPPISRCWPRRPRVAPRSLPFLERVGATPSAAPPMWKLQTSVQDWRTVQAATGPALCQLGGRAAPTPTSRVAPRDQASCAADRCRDPGLVSRCSTGLAGTVVGSREAGLCWPRCPSEGRARGVAERTIVPPKVLQRTFQWSMGPGRLEDEMRAELN